MTTIERNDIHRPSAPEFDPAAYSLAGVFDLNPDYPNPTSVAYRLKLINDLIARGFRCGAHGMGQCGHCGAYIRYAALMVREDAKQWIWIGETCLDGRFAMSKPEFDKLRKQAALDRARQAKLSAFRVLCEEHPAMAYATYSHNIEIGMEQESHDLARAGSLRPVRDSRLAADDYVLASGLTWGLHTMADIAAKSRKYGEASDKQIALVARIVAEQESKWDSYLDRMTVKADEAPAATLQVTGKRQVIEGTIISRKEVEDPYSYHGGTTWKMLVELADGTRVYGTEPSAFETSKGDKVRFAAAVKVSDKDPSFGFYSRPTQFEITERTPEAA
jgi:hypothetical protein